MWENSKRFHLILFVYISSSLFVLVVLCGWSCTRTLPRNLLVPLRDHEYLVPVLVLRSFVFASCDEAQGFTAPIVLYKFSFVKTWSSWSSACGFSWNSPSLSLRAGTSPRYRGPWATTWRPCASARSWCLASTFSYCSTPPWPWRACRSSSDPSVSTEPFEMKYTYIHSYCWTLTYCSVISWLN